jgi:hypothetical protein
MSGAAETFSGHRGIAPMLWVFASLATTELVVVHLFVALKWPAAAWGLTIVTALSIAWLVRYITSYKRCPHRLESDALCLRMGSMRSIVIPIAQVAGVRTHWASGAEKAAGSVNLVPIAFPNRLVDIDPPIAGRRGPLSTIAIRLDDPAAFDASLAARGVTIV